MMLMGESSLFVFQCFITSVYYDADVVAVKYACAIIRKERVVVMEFIEVETDDEFVCRQQRRLIIMLYNYSTIRLFCMIVVLI